MNRREGRRRVREERRRLDEEYMAEADGDPWRRLEEYPAVEEVRGGVSDAAGEAAVRGDPRIRRRYTPMEEAEMEPVPSPRYRGDDPEHHHSFHSWAGLGAIAPVMGTPSLAPTD